jgi:hypothetical protein
MLFSCVQTQGADQTVCLFNGIERGQSMGLVTKARNKTLKKQATGELSPRARELTGALYNQFQEYHGKSHWDDEDIERLLVKQKEYEIDNNGWFKSESGIPMFSPSSASKCERGLFFKALKSDKDVQMMFPYQQRWVRNSTAVHEATQRDLLYMGSKLANPSYTVQFNELGLPMWEKNNAQIKYFEHNGERFAIAGMMDGILTYTKDGSTIGFEFKTKSNSVAQVGNYKMKNAQDGHKMQCTGYSLLFGINEFLLMYEAVAKDNWMKGEEARMDIRTFYHQVKETEQLVLLDKLARVTKAVREESIPTRELDKCLFCEFKTVCGKGNI